MTRRISPACASDLQLDRWIAGELSPPDLQALAAHVGECASCRDRHAALSSEVQSARLPPLAALESYPGAPLAAAERGPRVSLRRWPLAGRWLAAGTLAAALALTISRLEPPAPNGERNGTITRTKGDAVALDWVVRRGAKVFAPDPAQPLRPGDGLRFGVRTSRSGSAAVLSLDGAGRSSVYHGWVPVQGGERQLLPGAIQLDDVLGDEHLYGLVCERAVSLAPVENAIRLHPLQPLLPEGCAVDHHVLRKVLP